jgi:uncharacterized membrane protein
MMSDLLVMAFSTEAKAEAVRRTLLDMHEDLLIEPGDAVIATNCASGLVKLNQLLRPARGHEVPQMIWGPLVELLCRTPLGGSLAKLGFDDEFMKAAGNTLRSGNSVLLLLIREMSTEKVVTALRAAGGKFLRSSFDESKKDALRAALARTARAAPATRVQP